MSIKGVIDELDDIEMEIKRNNYRNKELRERKKVLETEVDTYLESKNQDGMRYKGRAIVIERTEQRPQKKKVDKKSSVIGLLDAAGVYRSEELYERLLDVQKGDPIEKKKIKFKKLSKF